MTNIRMKANDTLHISSVSADNIPPNGEFVVSGEIADDLEKRGLAKRLSEEKAEPAAPSNKAESAAPANKAVSAKRKGK